MKKLAIVLTIMISFGLFASQAQAWGPFGGGSVTNAGSAVTADLRARLAAREAQYDTLLAQPSPDPKRISRLSQEIVALSNQLRAAAQADSATIPQGNYYAPPMGGNGYGGGYGRGYGMGMGMGCR